MPKLKSSQPKYCKHSKRNKAFFWKDGRQVLLPGAYNSPESLQAYNSQMALLYEERADEVAGRIKVFCGKINHLTVAELVAQFLKWGESYYVKNGKPTGSNADYELASRPLVDLYGHFQVNKITQRELISVRKIMVSKGLARKTINDRTCRIKRIFNWAASEGHISWDIAKNLECVENLKKGRSQAPDKPKVKPVADDIVCATIQCLPRVVGDMVKLQWLTGMRPGEIFCMKWENINSSDDIWLYSPETHKTEHHDIERIIPLNRSCQMILERYQDTPEDQIIFSPKRTIREKAEERAAKRKSKRQPSQIKRFKSQRRAEQYCKNESYNRYSYRTAIVRAAQKAGVKTWFPYQLRHKRLTEIEHKTGSKDAARLIAGHTSTKTTEIYLQRDIERIKEISRFLEKNEY
jgi:integrase